MDKESIKVSVVLPVYNAELTVSEAIESILVQTFKDFEIIIINDGSSDNSENVILSFNDKRIKYYSNDKNRGLIYSLNKGIELAQGKYIARMDADDKSFPTRLEKQFEVMEKYPEINVCGTLVEGFGNFKAKNFIFVAKERSEEIKRWMVIQSGIAHPTAMIRLKTLIENNIRYNYDYLHAEDYKLWIDLSNFGEFYNIQETLLYYRLSDTQVSQKSNTIQIENAKRCRREYICKVLKNDQINKAIEKGEITLSTLELIKKLTDSKEILEVFYMSLKHYCAKDLFYFIFSLDCCKFRLITTFAIFKRFLKGKNPVI